MSEQQRTVEIEGYRVHLTANGCHVYATESGALVGTTDAEGKAHAASRPGPIVASLGRLVERIAALAMQPPSPLPDVKVEQDSRETFVDGCRVVISERGCTVYDKAGSILGETDAKGKSLPMSWVPSICVEQHAQHIEHRCSLARRTWSVGALHVRHNEYGLAVFDQQGNWYGNFDLVGQPTDIGHMGANRVPDMTRAVAMVLRYREREILVGAWQAASTAYNELLATPWTQGRDAREALAYQATVDTLNAVRAHDVRHGAAGV